MSDVQRLKEQLHQVSAEAKQAAGGLAGFKLRFIQHSAQVESLIAGTATGVDRDISEILDAAGEGGRTGRGGSGDRLGRLQELRRPDLSRCPPTCSESLAASWSVSTRFRRW